MTKSQIHCSPMNNFRTPTTTTKRKRIVLTPTPTNETRSILDGAQLSQLSLEPKDRKQTERLTMQTNIDQAHQAVVNNTTTSVT